MLFPKTVPLGTLSSPGPSPRHLESDEWVCLGMVAAAWNPPFTITYRNKRPPSQIKQSLHVIFFCFLSVSTQLCLHSLPFLSLARGVSMTLSTHHVWHGMPTCHQREDGHSSFTDLEDTTGRRSQQSPQCRREGATSLHVLAWECMHVCVSICALWGVHVRVCMHVWMSVSAYVCLHAWVWVHVYAHTWVCACMVVHVCVAVCAHGSLCMCVHVWLCMCGYMCVHVYGAVCTCGHVYMCGWVCMHGRGVYTCVCACESEWKIKTTYTLLFPKWEWDNWILWLDFTFFKKK